MKYIYLLLILLLVGLGQTLPAQCPPPGFPDPGNTCPTAPILCENLDGYCSTINNNNTTQVFPGCPGWQLNNDEWFAFFAGSTSITIQVTPTNCSSGNMQGLQGGLYQSCGPPWIPMDLQCACTENPFILAANNFVVGQVYWIVLDGCAGNVCDYSIEVLDGSTVGVAPETPGAITGPVSVCPGFTSSYSIQPADAATQYAWTLAPPLGTVSGSTTDASITWADTVSGMTELCVTASNLCYENPTPSCLPVELIPNPTATLSGGGTICPGSGTLVGLRVDFTGEGPWEFTYSLDGQTQPAVQTGANPYEWQVSQPGTYTLASLVSQSINCPGPGTVSGTAVVAESGPVGPVLELGPDVIVCTDSAHTFNAGPGFVAYLWSDSSMLATFTPAVPGLYWVEVTDSCGFKQRDSVFFSYSLLADTQFPDEVICPGESLSYSAPGFNTYHWAPATGLSCTNCPTVIASPVISTEYTLLASDSLGCILRDTFLVTVLPQPAITRLFEFCPGESVLINGTAYNLPGTVLDTLPASAGCDTLATYVLQYYPLPQSSNLVAQCPANVEVTIPAGIGSTPVAYPDATASTNCPCGGAETTLTQGLLPGANFPAGITLVCYTATDSCETVNTCCFTVTVKNEPVDEEPCDVKNTPCLKFEILGIFQNTARQKTYRLQITNNCSNELTYVVFQLPNGITAAAPANGSLYTAPSGRAYEVRNPNYAPFYSIRFKSVGTGIAGGQSDVFEYTLPPQASPLFIHAAARLEPNLYYETHLNVFDCVVQQLQNRPEPASERAGAEVLGSQLPRVFPNPAAGMLFADLSVWEGQPVQVRVTDIFGRLLFEQKTTAGRALFELPIPDTWSAGAYQLELRPAEGPRQVGRFVVQR